MCSQISSSSVFGFSVVLNSCPFSHLNTPLGWAKENTPQMGHFWKRVMIKKWKENNTNNEG